MRNYLLLLLALIPQLVYGVGEDYRSLSPEIYFPEQIGFARRDESSGATVNALATTKSFVKLTSTVTTINGAVAPGSPVSRMVIISNQTGGDVTITNQSASATAANRFILAEGEDLVVPPGGSATFLYDHGASRWVAGGGGGGGGVSFTPVAPLAYDPMTEELSIPEATNSVDGFMAKEQVAAIEDHETRITDAEADIVTAQGAADDAQQDIDDHVADTAGAHAGTAISNSPSGNLAATTVQGALDELQTENDSQGTAIGAAQSDADAAQADATQAISDAADAQSDIDGHIADGTAAHAASAISNSPSGNLAATDVQGALNELQTDVDTRGNVNGQASSVDSEIALFSGTGGKTIKRATGSGLAKVTSGVFSVATAGTDYVGPTVGSGIQKGDGSGGLTAATAGTDYQVPITTGDGSTSGATLTLGSNVVTDAKFRQSAARSLVGRSANTTGNVADITASADYQIMNRQGGILGFSNIDLSQNGAVGSTVLGTRNGGTGNAYGPQAVVVPVALTAHGFSLGDIVYRTSGGSWAKAKADADATSESIGMVSTVTDANNVIVTSSGLVTGLTGLTDGAGYFLSDSTAGAYTATAPTAVGYVRKPVFVAIGTTSAMIKDYPGAIVNGSSGGTTPFEGAEFAGDGSCTVVRKTSGVTVTYGGSAGRCNLTFAAGRFSRIPMCSCNSKGNGPTHCSYNTSSATSVQAVFMNNSNINVDADGIMMCYESNF